MESLRLPGPHVQFCCFYFLCLRMLLFLQSVLSAPEVPAYHTLDVPASLRVTDTVPGGVEYKTKSKPRRTPWSLEVVHRDTLLRANASLPYKQRWEEILRRDATRIRGLEQQIERRLNKSAGSYENLSADFGIGVMSGLPQGSGEYLVEIGVGTPTRMQYMALDTGNNLISIPCNPCWSCYSQDGHIFNPATSTSFANVRCISKNCAHAQGRSDLEGSSCQDDNCRYRVDYSHDSYILGNMVTETLTFGSTYVLDVAIGCAHTNAGLFAGAMGVLGLGADYLSFPSQISTQMGSTFSYCLSDRSLQSSGTLKFGPDSVPDGSFFTAMLKNPYIPNFYYLSLDAISVRGRFVDSIPSDVFRIDMTSGRGGVLVDSGTTITRLQNAAYAALRDAFVAGTQHIPRAYGVSNFDTCYDLSGITTVWVPTVGFRFSNGYSLILPAKNYLTRMGTTSTFCFAFAPTDSSISIMGNVQQQSIGVSFDYSRSLIGFALNQC